jgi:monoterpene epsilon-lactone hydrolase
LDHVISLIKARVNTARRNLEDDRHSYEAMVDSMPIEEDIDIDRVGAGGVPAAWISAPGVSQDRVMLYVHGGGYVIGSMRSHGGMLAHISRATG